MVKYVKVVTGGLISTKSKKTIPDLGNQSNRKQLAMSTYPTHERSNNIAITNWILNALHRLTNIAVNITYLGVILSANS